ncbi:MAG: type I restriction-modification system subunit M N-terminal domain-containing protein, partial [Planctomycetia bacterium]
MPFDDAAHKGPPESPAGTTLTLNALESHLWEAANILRGSPLGRTDWMSYILPLLFFKRICDVWDEEAAAARELYGDSEFEDFPEAHRFQVPEACHWQDLRSRATNVGAALQSALRGVEKANDKHLYGVFGDATWTNKEQIPDALLKDLIEHFSSITLTNTAVTSDILGDAYEVLIKRFAEITNKKAGEFYTPRAVVRLMAAILDPKPGETVYDPRKKAKEIEIKLADRLRKRSSDPKFKALAERLEELKEKHEKGLLASVDFLKALLTLAKDTVAAEKDTDERAPA